VPTQIIELDPLVPDAIEFRYQGKSYTLPGEVSVETTFRLQKLLVALRKAEVEAGAEKNGAVDQQEKLTLEVEDLLLGLFKQTDPDLERLPFGAIGFQHVLAHLLIKLGFAEVEVEDPTKTEPPPKKSRRSSTSRSS
jgi:hypothetical protein